MRLLVTRPTANAVALAEHLARLGHDVVVSPVIEIFANDAPLPPLTGLGGLAFTSANGVYALTARLTATTAPAWQKLPAYAVGPQTAEALRRAGWPEIHQADGDVAALSDLISAHYDKQAGAILHLAGRHRAGNLAAALAASGVDCQLAVLYEAEPADALSQAALAALADDEAPLDGVLLYSQRSATHFLTLVADAPMAHKPTAYCLSPKIATRMQAAGYPTQCAATPDEAALLALLA